MDFTTSSTSTTAGESSTSGGLDTDADTDSDTDTDTDSDTDADTDSDSDTDTGIDDVPAVCVAGFFGEPVRDCGTHDLELCSEHAGMGACALDSVQACVLLAIEDGVTFEFVEVGTGPDAGEKEEVTLKVLEGWRSLQNRVGFFDGCTTLEDLTLRAGAPLDACEDLACVRQALAEARVVTECGADVDCS